jgi:hypothetical protein
MLVIMRDDYNTIGECGGVSKIRAAGVLSANHGEPAGERLRQYRPEAILPRGQHKYVARSIELGKLWLWHRIDMQEALIAFGKREIGNCPDMDQFCTRHGTHCRNQQIASFLKGPIPDKYNRYRLG